MCHSPLGMIIVDETIVFNLCLHVNQLLTNSLLFVNSDNTLF